jgi:type II secretory ATPase GspE/PulE/Tfp pilus assembly ATPase PilB-like protein
LRALLRQDPDVMLIGEIRDQDTAEIATHAALTGHLVLSTLHTNDAASALTRLLDLGVPPYLIGSTVEAVLAQRLVRRICEGCREWIAAPPDLGRAFEGEVLPDQISRGAGCDGCRCTGYHGRTGIYELLVLDEELRDAVIRRASSSEIRGLAGAKGMKSLKQEGLALIRSGVTTTEEVLRAGGA